MTRDEFGLLVMEYGACELSKIYTQIMAEYDRLTAENAALKDAARWIPCKERMPDCDTLVLVATKYGVDVAVFDNHDWWDREDDNRMHTVTHWMPLPPAPEVRP